MKIFFLILFLSFNLEAQMTNNFHNLKANSIKGEEIDFSEYRNKVVMVINTASKCGFTSQYEGLEELYKEYNDRGLVILGFPSNDFGNQEPADNQEIAKFCKLNFGVSFPMFEKIIVKGEAKHPVYKFLTESSPEMYQGEVGWNFVKFLIDKNGNVRGRFSSMTKPDSKKIIKLLNELINENN